MDVTTTLEQEVTELISGNRVYSGYYQQWLYLMQSYLGGEDYRQAGLLTRYQLETAAEYDARLKATPLENHCASVISVYNSFIFRQDPTREYGSLTGMPELEDFLEDADMDGRSLNAFMKDVSTWSNVFGHCWVVLAKPNLNLMTRADEQMMGVRPYVNLLTPLTVLDWQWTRTPSGRYELEYFRYIEDINGDVSTIKEWTRTEIRTTVVDTKDKLIREQTIEENQLNMIPAVCAYNRRSMVRGIGISAIADIADWQRFIYNCSSEIDQSIRLDTHPSLVKTPETQAGVGAGAIIHMPDNLDPGLKPYVLDFAGASVSNILDVMKHGIDSIDKMANTGAVRTVESRTMSGVAMETEFALLNARLSESADNLELAEEGIWKLWAVYMGYTWDGEIDYPGSFNIRDTGREVQQLQTAKSAATDPRVIAAIDAKLLDWLDLDEDELAALRDGRIIRPDTLPAGQDYYEFAPHTMVDPITGEERTVTSQEEHVVLANQGWYHKQ